MNGYSPYTPDEIEQLRRTFSEVTQTQRLIATIDALAGLLDSSDYNAWEASK